MDQYEIESLFISDLHLGVKYNNIHLLVNILNKYKFKNLFLVGDIIDFWALSKKPRWKKSYNSFIKKIIELSKTTNIFYITGNHDDVLRMFCPIKNSAIEVHNEYIYKNILVIHGDKFDQLIYSHRWLYFMGEYGYNLLIFLDRFLKLNGSLSKKAKKIVKNASNYLNDFYNAAEKYTLSRKCDTIVCGHTHIQEYQKLNNKVDYYNCGDFRESCDYIIEDKGGKLHLLRCI
jgi:UDP-2,3-diacylglucosamine pyrophosphatase LpxH